MAESMPKLMANMRHDRRQQTHAGFECFALDSAGLRGVAIGLSGDFVEQLHNCGNRGIEGLAATAIIRNFFNGLVSFASQLLLLFVKINRYRSYITRGKMAVTSFPQTFEEAMRTLNTGITPLQCLLGRRGKHSEQTNGIGTVEIDRGLWVNAVVLGFGHLNAAAHFQFASFKVFGAGDLAFFVALESYISGVVPSLRAIVIFLKEAIG